MVTDRNKWPLLCAALLLGTGAAGYRVLAGSPRYDDKEIPARKQEKQLVKITPQVAGVIAKLATGRLKVGDRVEKGQVLVELDDAKAQLGVEIEKANLKAVEADLRAAEAMLALVQKEMQRNEKLHTLKAISLEEYEVSKLVVLRYKEEALAKTRGVKLTQLLVTKAQQHLEFHHLRSPGRGIVREVYKVRGEGVKALESVILIEALE